MKNSIERRCRQRGLRITERRRMIAQVLSDANDYPDITELLVRVRARDRRFSLATLYPTLRVFEDAGIIERHSFNETTARFEATPPKHHDHLIDVATGTIVEFTSPEIERLQRKIARELGFHLVGHRLELYGIRSQATTKARPRNIRPNSKTPN